jgi:Zn finger protein HypA/HybF involved in hydrogenase expression
MEEKAIVLRCKLCNGKVPVTYDVKKVTCPSCQQDWNIRWFQEDSAMIISPASWKEYAQKERVIKD